MSLISPDPVFIVGAQRCGTTYLCHVFTEHPQIILAQPLRPEPKFFMQPSEVAKGIKHYFAKHYSHAVEVLNSFEKNYEGYSLALAECASKRDYLLPSGSRIIVEKSASYIESRDAALRIKQMFPGAKILISLRDPAFRAVSNYYFSVINGVETRSPREVFFEKLPPPPLEISVSVSPFDYLARGEYSRYLRNYFDIFGKESIKIVVFERFVENITAIQEIYQWLGVDATFVANSLKNKINASNVDECPVVEDDLLEYLKEYYRPHIDELEQLLGEEFPEWRDPTDCRLPAQYAGSVTSRVSDPMPGALGHPTNRSMEE